VDPKEGSSVKVLSADGMAHLAACPFGFVPLGVNEARAGGLLRGQAVPARADKMVMVIHWGKGHQAELGRPRQGLPSWSLPLASPAST
jgi:hypothetical protein